MVHVVVVADLDVPIFVVGGDLSGSPVDEKLMDAHEGGQRNTNTVDVLADEDLGGLWSGRSLTTRYRSG